MNPRILLALLVMTLLLVGAGAWWMLENKSTRTDPSPSVESSTPTPSEPTNLDVAQSPTPSPRERIEPATPARAQTPHDVMTRTRGNFSFTGRVKSAADGTNIAGAHVHLESIEAIGPLDPPIADYSDQSGEYAIYAVPVGNWVLVCSAPAYMKSEVRVFMPTSGGKKQQDIQLQPDPLVNVVLHLHALGGGSMFDHLEADDAVLVDLLRPVFVEKCPQRGSDLPPGTSVIAFQGRAVEHKHAVTDEWQRVQLRSARGGYCAVLLDDRVLDAVAFSPGMSDLTLVVSIDDLHRATGSVRLALANAVTSAPLAGARVSLRSAAGPTRVVTTDTDGRAEIALVVPGEAVCEIDAVDHAVATLKVTIQAGNPTDLGTIQLPATVVVSGRIDMPPAGKNTRVSVFACRVADQDGAAFETPVAAHADGTFEFERLYPGEYVIGWRHENPPPDPSAVRTGEVAGWVYVSVRAREVRGVHVVVTPAMWNARTGDGRASR